MICHFLISYPGVCPLDLYVSFPGMMQDDKGNIKVNLGITLIIQQYVSVTNFGKVHNIKGKKIVCTWQKISIINLVFCVDFEKKKVLNVWCMC